MITEDDLITIGLTSMKSMNIEATAESIYTDTKHKNIFINMLKLAKMKYKELPKVVELIDSLITKLN